MAAWPLVKSPGEDGCGDVGLCLHLKCSVAPRHECASWLSGQAGKELRYHGFSDCEFMRRVQLITCYDLRLTITKATERGIFGNEKQHLFIDRISEMCNCLSQISAEDIASPSETVVT